MTKIEHYMCDDMPRVKDIQEAFEIVKSNNVIVCINWYVKHSGRYQRFLSKELAEEITPEEFWEKYIPHIYGM